jgi:hypothetical protein
MSLNDPNEHVALKAAIEFIERRSVPQYDDAQDARRYRFLRDTFFTSNCVPDSFTGDLLINPPMTGTFAGGIYLTRDQCHSERLDKIVDAGLSGDGIPPGVYVALKDMR